MAIPFCKVQVKVLRTGLIGDSPIMYDLDDASRRSQGETFTENAAPRRHAGRGAAERIRPPMSRFLDQLERISQNAPTPLGFGVTRGERTPGMALVALVSDNHAEGCAAIAGLSPDGVLLSGIDGPAGLESLKDGLPYVPWGVHCESLTPGDAKAYQEAGCDLLTFGLEGTRASALSSDELARVLCIGPRLSNRQARAIDALPVDVLLVDIHDHSGPWTLADIAAVAGVSRRVDKYVLLHLSQPPEKDDLEAIRNVGVQGLAIDVGAVSLDSLQELKANLLDMPRQRSRQRGRNSAAVPSSVFPSGGRTPEPEREDEDDDLD